MTCDPCKYHFSDVRYFDYKIEVGRKGVFDHYRNARLRRLRRIKYGRKNRHDRERILLTIDYLSNILIQVRKYETPLRPAIFARASYT